MTDTNTSPDAPRRWTGKDLDLAAELHELRCDGAEPEDLVGHKITAAMLRQGADALRAVARVREEIEAIRLFMYQRKDNRGLDLAATNSAINRLAAVPSPTGVTHEQERKI